MPRGIAWFKIHLCYKLQQMVVRFFQMDFFFFQQYFQKNPNLSFLHPFSFLIIANFWKKRKNELRNVDFLFCSFEFHFSFSEVPDGALASTSTTLLHYPGQGTCGKWQVCMWAFAESVCIFNMCNVYCRISILFSHQHSLLLGKDPSCKKGDQLCRLAAGYIFEELTEDYLPSQGLVFPAPRNTEAALLVSS